MSYMYIPCSNCGQAFCKCASHSNYWPYYPPSPPSAEEIAEKVAALLVAPAHQIAKLWEKDPHQFSSRPCETCRQISAVLGRAFGCEAKK